jgi:hypothetical protein
VFPIGVGVEVLNPNASLPVGRARPALHLSRLLNEPLRDSWKKRVGKEVRSGAWRVACGAGALHQGSGEEVGDGEWRAVELGSCLALARGHRGGAAFRTRTPATFPGLTVQVRSTMLCAPKRLSLPTRRASWR